MEENIIRLNLISPLFFETVKGLDPFGGDLLIDKNTELLFCYELHEKEYLNFEPDKSKLLEKLIFSGKKCAIQSSHIFELPAGNYIFSQKRELMIRDDIMALAVEVQTEALWQRLEPGKRLYLRYLYEDEKPVTQLFRPAD